MDQSRGEARLRESCNETISCIGKFVVCTINRYCRCKEGYSPNPTDPHSCSELVVQSPEPLGTDPTMIGVVVGLALMSVTLCIVMRLFAKARFADNRTIFNTANPRLMNVSLKAGRTDGAGRSNRSGGGALEESRPFRHQDSSANMVGETSESLPMTETKRNPV